MFSICKWGGGIFTPLFLCKIGYDVLTNKYIAFLESEGSASNVYSKDEVDNLIDNVNTNITTNKNEITNIKSSIETLQTSLNDYALKSELQETNTNLDNVSQIVSSNTSSITDLTTSVDTNTTNISNLETVVNKKQNVVNIGSAEEIHSNKPWLLLKTRVEDGSIADGSQIGVITCGGIFAYSGFFVTSWGSWIIHSYSGNVIHVKYSNGTWSYRTISAGNFSEF